MKPIYFLIVETLVVCRADENSGSYAAYNINEGEYLDWYFSTCPTQPGYHVVDGEPVIVGDEERLYEIAGRLRASREALARKLASEL